MKALATLERITRDLATMDDVVEVKDLRDKGQAVRAYAEARHVPVETQNAIALVNIRFDRRLGEILADLEKHPGGGDQKHRSDNATGVPTLRELGITRDLSSRCQRLADIDPVELDAWVAQVTATGGELSTAGALRLLNKRPTAGPGNMGSEAKDAEGGTFATHSDMTATGEDLAERLRIEKAHDKGTRQEPQTMAESVEQLTADAKARVIQGLEVAERVDGKKGYGTLAVLLRMGLSNE